MSTKDHYSLDNMGETNMPDATVMKFAIVVSEWNANVTGRLLDGALRTLQAHGVSANRIRVEHVPGSFELTFASAQIIRHTDADAVIALGSVVRGDTPHFDYVCMGVTEGITRLNAESDKPVIFGLLTTDNMEQAMDRAGGKLGNKGSECALTAIKMVDLFWRLKK